MDSNKLDESQKQAVSKLQNLLIDFAEAAERPISECFPLISSTFAILGGRGSGKSSLLNHFYHHSGSRKNPCINQSEQVGNSDEWRGLRQQVMMLKPMDCSTLPEDCEPGMAVLTHVYEYLYENLHSSSKYCSKELDSLMEELKNTIGLYTRIGRGYNELSLDLSGSPEDYGDYLSSGLRARMGMRDRLTQWLDAYFSYLKRIEGNNAPKVIVVLLDDFDLTPNSYQQTQHWISSLLDELCQRRLGFIVTADFYRLEHLAWGKPTDFDKKTGFAIVNKFLSPQHRVSLAAFIKRQCFVPKNHPKVGEESSASKARLLELFPSTEDKHIELSQLIDAVLQQNVVNKAVFYSLLPSMPRGLEGLYLSLKSSLISQDKGENFPQHKLLYLLATSRNESILARTFTPMGMEALFYNLRFENLDMEVEPWNELIDRATLRPRFRQEQDDYSLLNLEVSLEGEAYDTKEMPIGLDSAMSRDPLRRQAQEKRLLKDANEGERNLWAELILDAHLASSSRHRAGLLLDWPVTNNRLERAAFRFDPNLEIIRRFISSNYDLDRANFYWMQFDGAADSDYIIGWPSLFSALRWKRDPFDPKFFTALETRSLYMKGALPTPDSLELLPNRLWAILLFVDGLYRCPWSAFSGASIWNVETYLGLASAFVRSAYAYALQRAFPNAPLVKFSEVQQRFVDMIHNRDPAKFLLDEQSFRREDDVLLCLEMLFMETNNNFEVNVKAQCRELLLQIEVETKRRKGEPLSDDEKIMPKPDYEYLSLVSAATSYLDSPIYQSAVKLLRPYWRKIPHDAPDKSNPSP